MTGAADQGEPIAGYFAPVHRALTEQILLGGAPRSLAIVNGTLAQAICVVVAFAQRPHRLTSSLFVANGIRLR